MLSRMRVTVVLLAILAFAVALSPAYANYAVPDREHARENDVTSPPTWSFETFQQECQAELDRVKTAVQTAVRSVVTVVKAVVRVLYTVVISLVKLVVRTVFTVVVALAQWMLAALLTA